MILRVVNKNSVENSVIAFEVGFELLTIGSLRAHYLIKKDRVDVVILVSFCHMFLFITGYYYI